MNTSDDTERHPRITRAYAKSLIASEKIIVEMDLQVVICIVKLKHGHRLTADAIVANRSTFDIERGTQIARDKIIDQIMKLEMYVLRTELHKKKLREVNNVD